MKLVYAFDTDGIHDESSLRYVVMDRQKYSWNRRPQSEVLPAHMTTILLIIVVVLLLGGGGFYYRGRR